MKLSFVLNGQAVTLDVAPAPAVAAALRHCLGAKPNAGAKRLLRRLPFTPERVLALFAPKTRRPA